MDLPHPMDTPRIEEDPLGGGGLPGIDMRHNSDITISFDGRFTCHGL